MTGLYIRKILTPELEQRLQKLVQSGSSVMFIAIDMDKLKQINDTLGHQEGDLAITLHDAYKASDERLYVNKQNKNSRS